MELFKIGGDSPYTNYLFLGDYVDRGYYSIECISLLLCLKIRFPNRIYLIRGDHESRYLTQTYGFYEESIRKYGNCNVWKYFTNLFDYLPLSAVIESKIFCVHGGLSPEIETINDINKLDRIQETPFEGPLQHLVSSVPECRFGWAQSPYGVFYKFGQNITKEFIYSNNLGVILRSHELQMDGYDWYHDGMICTIFSAPNYCHRCGNKAAIMELDEYFNSKILQYGPNPIQKTKDQEDDNKRMPDYFL